jgi:hypothetical protein
MLATPKDQHARVTVPNVALMTTLVLVAFIAVAVAAPAGDSSFAFLKRDCPADGDNNCCELLPVFSFNAV